MVTAAFFAALLAGAATTPVTVEIVTSGHIETPADRYRASGNVLACAATQGAADALLASKIAALDGQMTALGVTRADTAEKFSLAGMMGGFMSARGASDCNKSSLDEMLSEKKTEAKDDEAAKVGASMGLSYDAPDRATATRVIALLKAADAKPSEKAVAVLIDDTAAKRAAKQQALAKAQTEADAYGGPLGLGRATMTVISERQDLGSMDFLAQMMRMIGLPGAGATDKVVTDVTLTVTFRLDGGR